MKFHGSKNNFSIMLKHANGVKVKYTKTGSYVNTTKKELVLRSEVFFKPKMLFTTISLGKSKFVIGPC